MFQVTVYRECDNIILAPREFLEPFRIDTFVVGEVYGHTFGRCDFLHLRTPQEPIAEIPIASHTD
jgi:hypothetical protein